MSDKKTRSSGLLIGFPEYADPARALALTAGLAYETAEIHRFPDGESRIRLPAELPERVVFCRSLHRPNEKLVELLLAATTARKLNARHLTLVAPYLCYMRQDKAFRYGEAISQSIVGSWLARMFDALLTVDPHLHRVRNLRDAVPMDAAIALSAAKQMAAFLIANLECPLLLGPDSESEQWVAAIAHHGSLSYRVADKRRIGDREVHIVLPAGEYTGRHVVLLDDIASTGCTLQTVVHALRPLEPASISVLVTHALFENGAERRLLRAGVDRIWSCDTVPHPTNYIKLTETLTSGLSSVFEDLGPSPA